MNRGRGPATTVAHMIPLRHPWNVTVAEAVALQRQLAPLIILEDRWGPLRTVAGVDVAYGRKGRSAVARAAVVVFDAETKARIGEAVAILPVEFPYVPGLLSFREAPAAIEAVGRLPVRPDLLFCDGQGRAHPRRIGIASHLGLVLDIPSIGVGKSPLVGGSAEPGRVRGERSPLVDAGEVVGCAVRSRAGVKPIYVSVGHRVSLDSAIRLALAWTGRYRLPEPIRAADALSKRIAREGRLPTP